MDIDDFFNDHFGFDNTVRHFYNVLSVLPNISLHRTTRDSVCNNEGKILLEICKSNNLFILNSGCGKDKEMGAFTLKNTSTSIPYLSQLMRLWYLSHRRPAKVQSSLRIRAVSPEPSLFAHMKYGSGRRVRPQIRHLAPLDGWTCAFEDEFTEDEKYHSLMRWLI